MHAPYRSLLILTLAKGTFAWVDWKLRKKLLEDLKGIKKMKKPLPRPASAPKVAEDPVPAVPAAPGTKVKKEEIPEWQYHLDSYRAQQLYFNPPIEEGADVAAAEVTAGVVAPSPLLSPQDAAEKILLDDITSISHQL